MGKLTLALSAGAATQGGMKTSVLALAFGSRKFADNLGDARAEAEKLSKQLQAVLLRSSMPFSPAIAAAVRYARS